MGGVVRVMKDRILIITEDAERAVEIDPRGEQGKRGRGSVSVKEDGNSGHDKSRVQLQQGAGKAKGGGGKQKTIMRKALVTGGKRLSGKVSISGSKNAALPILAATILLHGETTLTNVPNLLDVITMIRVLRALGLRAEYYEPNTVKICTNDSIKHVAPYELVTKMRASFFIIGPILARMGLAKVPLPGGCDIGSRPVDMHIKGLEALGAKVEMEHGFVIVKANKLKGAKIYLDFPSVGATETIMMAATCSEGETVIENAAQEPEIADLAEFLNRCGAKDRRRRQTDTIKVAGAGKLKGIEYRVMPDRIEACTLMVAGAITKGDIP